MLLERRSKSKDPLAEPVHQPRPASHTAWRAIGWFGVVMALIGLTDAALHWYPMDLGSPEWEFAASARSIASLPTATVGLAAILGSFLARGVRGGVIWSSVTLILVAVFILTAFVLFMLNVPLALGAVDGPAGLTLVKTVIRTIVMAVTLSAAYLIAAGLALRSITRKEVAR